MNRQERRKYDRQVKRGEISPYTQRAAFVPKAIVTIGAVTGADLP